MGGLRGGGGGGGAALADRRARKLVRRADSVVSAGTHSSVGQADGRTQLTTRMYLRNVNALLRGIAPSTPRHSYVNELTGTPHRVSPSASEPGQATTRATHGLTADTDS